MLLDTLGCAIAGADAPGIGAVVGLECELAAPGKGSVLMHRQSLALPSAAACNSSMIHALDFDNNYPGADIHVLSIVVPVALACAEEKECSGREFLAGVILGVEAAARLAKPYLRARRTHSYFLTTSLVGGWGGMAAAGRLLSLTEEQMVNALGIYYAHTCGNRQALLEMSLTKRILPGIAAKAALYSALLAQRGITGPEYTFEGKAGFYRLYTREDPPPEAWFSDPPAPYGIEELVSKHYPTCGIHHANIVSALRLRAKHEFRAEDIETVEFFLCEGGNTLVSAPFELGTCPQVNAQFSAPYAIALALSTGGVEVGQFTNEAILADRDTLALARRVVEVTRFAELGLEDVSAPVPGMRYLKVTLRDGRVFQHSGLASAVNCVEGTTPAWVEEKFRTCASMSPSMSNTQADRVVDAVGDLEAATRVQDLVNLL